MDIQWWNSKNSNLDIFKYLYPNSDLPKFNVGDEVMLVDDFINVNNNYINYHITNNEYEKFNIIKKENNYLIINRIAYNVTNNIVYYSFKSINDFLGQKSLKPYQRIDYNTPKKLVYEKIMSFEKFNKNK